MTNVRSYTDKQLLDRVKAIPGFTSIPTGFWLIFVRSTEDAFDLFDDKTYLFKGEAFVMVTSCTTNKGAKGTAVIRADQWLYEGFVYGMHRDTMPCLRQNKNFEFYRDRNADGKTDESGSIYTGNIQTQFHGSTYRRGSKTVVKRIGLWSEGCIVCNVNADYEKIISLTKEQKVVSGCLLKEFSA